MNSPASQTLHTGIPGDLRRPPSADARREGFMLAVGAHVLLVIALAIGVNWRSHDATALSAELWAAVPSVAAPPPRPAPQPTTQPEPRPQVQPPKPPPPAPREADIAVEKKPVEKPKPQPEPPKPVDDQKQKEFQLQQKQDEAKRKQEEAKRKQEELRREKEAEAARADQLKRIMAQAGSNSNADASTGNAARTAAPSSAYAGRIRARILPNITFTDPVTESHVAEVDVRVAPDGRIISRTLRKSSGIPAWDDAVLRAIDKTEVLPRDVDGRVPPAMTLSFDPLQR